MTKNFSVVPSELRLSQKWDYAIENFLIRPTVGFFVGGLISVVLFRKFFYLCRFAVHLLLH